MTLRSVSVSVSSVAVHPVQAVLHDVGDLVAEGRVVVHDRRVRRREQRRVPVGVLQPLAGQRRAPGGRPDEEAAGHLVGRRPDRVARALEPEHRVEDVDRDHRLAVRRVARPDGRERRHRPGLVDAEVEDLAVLRLAVGEHQLGVDGRVVLPVRVVDLDRREEAVHPEGAGLVGDDRHDPLAELLVAHEVLEQPDERHRRRDLLLARALLDLRVGRVVGQVHRRRASTRRSGTTAAELGAGARGRTG